MNASLAARLGMERVIRERVVADLIAAGYALNVDNGDNNGEDYELPAPSKDPAAVLAAMNQTDDERLYVWTDAPAENPEDDHKPMGWVLFVYGNDGYDVVSDYTTNLETALKGSNDLADAIDAGEFDIVPRAPKGTV